MSAVPQTFAAAGARALCFHCAGPIPTGTAHVAKVAGVDQAMCCPGCAAVAQLIDATGMAGYYRARSAPARSQRPEVDPHPPASSPESISLALFDDPLFQQAFAAARAPGPGREAHLALHHLRCGACSWLIESHLRRQGGVLDVQVNTVASRMVLTWDPARTSLSVLVEALRAIGYDATPWQAVQGSARNPDVRARRRLAELVVAGLGMMQVMMYAVPVYLADAAEITARDIQLMNWAALALTLPVILFSAQGIFLGAWRDLQARRLGMDVPVSLGLAAAFLGSLASLWRGSGPVWFDSVTMFVFLLLGSRWLEEGVRARAALLGSRLAPAVPAQTLVVDADGSLAPAVVLALAPGRRIRVAIGAVIPVDGTIVAGAGPVAEAVLTGESAPHWRAPGDPVLAGSLNLGEVLDVQVDAVGADSVLARVLRRMDQALGERTVLARLADRAARRFVLALLLITALCVIAWCWHDPSRALGVAIAVLVVSCPCALSLAVPATMAASAARLARRGLLLLDGSALETLGRARTVVFDKTGTLTCGAPVVTVDWLSGDPAAQRRCAAIALALEAQQPHPYARAICAELLRWFPELEPAALSQRITHLSRGVAAMADGEAWRIGQEQFAADRAVEGSGAVCLSRDGAVQVRFRFVDPLRPGAATLVAGLQAAGIRTVLLSGDHPAAADELAARVGIAESAGGLTPEGKLLRVRALQAAGPVVMVGDGLNDAPGFGAADLAIAVGDVSQALARGAGALLPDGDLTTLARALREARDALRRIRQNLAWALAYNLCAIPLAAGGWLTPWEAGLGMSLSSLLVVLNGMRPWKS